MTIKRLFPAFLFCIGLQFIFAESAEAFFPKNYFSAWNRNKETKDPVSFANLELHCPTNLTVAPCMTTVELDSIYTAWKTTASYSGGCNAFLAIEQVDPPSICGGSVAVLFSAISDCDSTIQCTAIFTVDSASSVQLICPSSQVETSCQSQSAILQKFEDWMLNVQISGGCALELNKSFPHYPNACGDRVTVEFTVSSNCDTNQTCKALFVVEEAPALNLTCPANQLEDTGQTQVTIDSLFLAWKNGFSFTGGCNAVMSMDSVKAPKSIGGSSYMTFTVSSECYNPVECKDTFEVRSINPVILFCPPYQKENSCQTAEEISAKFEIWKNLFHFTGGCNPILTINSNNTPLACGEITTVNFSIFSECEHPSTCTAIFEVSAPDSAQLICPSSQTLISCLSQEHIDSAFISWKNSASFSGGCNTQFTNDGGVIPNRCGGSTTITYKLTSDCDSTITCSSTFNILTAPIIQLNCPKNVLETSCQSQNLINSKFEDWKKTAFFIGGCNGILSYDNGAAPNACGGLESIHYVVNSTCETNVSCTSTFEVLDASQVVISCPTSRIETACQLQEIIDEKFNAWIKTASFTGGCNTSLIHDGTSIPPSCGGSVTITFTAISNCDSLKSCSANFTVLSAGPVQLTCPIDVHEISCQSQASINAKFSLWKNTAVFSGGCNAVLSNNGNIPPSACGGITTVSFTIHSECEMDKSCTSTFRIDTANPVILTCPVLHTEAACQSQEIINTKYEEWKKTVVFTGGCNSTLINSGMLAPNNCGGSATITYTVISDCESSSTCNATFLVSAAAPVVLTCPPNVTEAACQTQTLIDSKFNAWKKIASFTGSCNGILLDNSGNAPDKCGGTAVVSYVVTSDCQTQKTCSATFTVSPAPKVQLTCPEDIKEVSCQSQFAIDSKFDTWINSATFRGGCNAVFTNSGGRAPNKCGGSTMVTYAISSDCDEPKNCTVTFQVLASPPVVLSCPANIIEMACQSTSIINSKFSAWKNSASFSGGCNAILSNSNRFAPDKCGGSTNITFTVNSDCETPKSCSTSFTVLAAPEISLICPDSIQVQNSDSISDLLLKYEEWKKKAILTGGCNTFLSISSDSILPIQEGTVTVLFSAKSDCDTIHSCTSKFVVLKFTDVKDFASSNFELFPNPAHDFIILKNKTKDVESYGVQIVNIIGNSFFKQKNIILQDEYRLKTDQLPAGHYILKISRDKLVKDYKFEIIR